MAGTVWSLCEDSGAPSRTAFADKWDQSCSPSVLLAPDATLGVSCGTVQPYLLQGEFLVGTEP